jgi:hypothetical protein
MSFGMIVTRLAWIANHSTIEKPASGKRGGLIILIDTDKRYRKGSPLKKNARRD